MMELFINGAGCISPQLSFDNSVFLSETKEYLGNKLFCTEPDYSVLFDAASVRRMSRVIKFAVGAAIIALRESGVNMPGAIATGTGLGLLENSGKFLKNVIEHDESLVSPTPFIQSTHNTIGGIIALMAGCHAHNFTFSQKGISFEGALNDARMLMAETDTDNCLLGGFDELTEYSLAIMSRLNILRKEPCSNLELYGENGNGIIAGEGASFFVLSKEMSVTSYAKLIDNQVFFQPENIEDIENKIIAFLDKNELSVKQLDVVITGLGGDKERDKFATELNRKMFLTQTISGYKHLCGEYMTSSSFAFWLAAKMLKTGDIPESTILENRFRQPKSILIYNSYKSNHSLILFKSC